MSADAPPTRTPHPARFSDPILAHLVRFLLETQTDEPRRLVDCFAGTGRIHELSDHVPNLLTYGVELEREWADQHPRNRVGDSRHLTDVCRAEWGMEPGSVDVFATSPSYGSRVADLYDGRDGSKRYTYRLALGHDLTEGNSGGLQWGSTYRNLHSDVWRECVEMLRPGGLMIVNVSNHIRDGKEIPVVEWHLGYLLGPLGLYLVKTEQIQTRRMKNGANRDARAECEHLLILRKP